MRIASLHGEAVLTGPEGGVVVGAASAGRLPSAAQDLLAVLDDVAAWWDRGPDLDPDLSTDALGARLGELDPPVAAPGQVFAIGVNYRSHGAETGIAVPAAPMVFTKFPSCIAGPGAEIPLPTATCDWEVELVAVIGSGGRDIPAASALDHVAGLCVGQDVSERAMQMAGSPPQFSLAKSFPAFGPIGPWLTTLDEVADPADLAISCRLDDEVVQDGRTSDMVFDLPTLVAHLSSVCELRPGDLVFTGTPDGVGFTQDPPRALAPGTVLRSRIQGLGELVNRTRAGA